MQARHFGAGRLQLHAEHLAACTLSLINVHFKQTHFPSFFPSTVFISSFSCVSSFSTSGRILWLRRLG